MEVFEVGKGEIQATSPEPKARMPQWGEPAPWFKASTHTTEVLNFHTVAGRPVILSFLGQIGSEEYKLHLSEMASVMDRLSSFELQFYCVSSVPILHRSTGERDPYVFHDPKMEIAQSYGINELSDAHVFVMDERLRVIVSAPLVLGCTETIEHEISKALSAEVDSDLCTRFAPALVVPRVFESDFCSCLIDYYDNRGGEASGFMRDVGGQTLLFKNPRHKVRRDAIVEDERLRNNCRRRVISTLIPEIKRVFQFDATRIERYVVACYDSKERGHFSRHRDNTTLGTAHRQFAVSVNLNTGEYDGGELRFPEFGTRLYQAPPGGAIVFSCSLLHEARPVTKGKRYAFLPFLYNEGAAGIRQESRKFIGGLAR